MATQNLTRKLGFHKKRGVCVFTAVLDLADTSDFDLTTSGDDYELFTLPEEAYVTKAEMLVLTANNAGTSAVANVGFAGGDTLIDGGDLTSAANTALSGGTNAVVPQLKTTSGVVTYQPTYAGTAPTAGKVLLVIEYVEHEKATGEVTNFSETA